MELIWISTTSSATLELTFRPNQLATPIPHWTLPSDQLKTSPYNN